MPEPAGGQVLTRLADRVYAMRTFFPITATLYHM
jgi:hypothetical protein